MERSFRVAANPRAGFDLKVVYHSAGQEAHLAGPFVSPDEAEAHLHRYLERTRQERVFDQNGNRGGVA